MARGKNPTVAQCNVLKLHNRNPKDWLYTGESVIGSDGSRRLSKNDYNTVRLKFIHRTTGQEIFLEKN